MNDKQAAQLGIDSRTYDPKKNLVEEIMKIIDQHEEQSGLKMSTLRQDLIKLINSL